MKKVRESNIELLRIVLMLFIVIHHCIIDMHKYYSNAWLDSVDVVLHTAVPIFVLISGYFGIRFQMKRFIGLLLEVVFYSFSISLLFGCFSSEGVSVTTLLKSFMPFTNKYYWFISVYLQLYLVSMFVNSALEKMSFKRLVYGTIVLLFLNVWVGLLFQDAVLSTGKNIINFIGLYSFGYIVRYYQCDSSKALVFRVIWGGYLARDTLDPVFTRVLQSKCKSENGVLCI